MKNLIHIIIFSGLLLACTACTSTNDMDIEPLDHEKEYLFLGHPYFWEGGGKRVDPRIERLYLDAYNGVWLGGDVCSETTRSYATIQYLDCLFDLRNPLNFWATGNHDLRNGNIEWIEFITERPTFYTHHHEGITYIVLNTSMSYLEGLKERCEMRQEQFNLLTNVLDTIETSSHLVLLTHHNIWGDIEGMECTQVANACSPWFNLLCNDKKSTYREAIHPLMQVVSARGVKIVAVAGDGGQKSKKYEFTDSSNISYLISGINNSFDMEKPSEYIQNQNFNTNPDSVLIFTHHTVNRTFDWKFVAFNELVQNHQQQFEKELSQQVSCH